MMTVCHHELESNFVIYFVITIITVCNVLITQVQSQHAKQEVYDASLAPIF